MSFIGVLGALLGLLALPWAFVNRSNGRLGIFALMMLMHLVVSVIYYYYVQTHDADTRMYYADPYGFFGKSGTGTWFTINLVQTMRLWIGGTYLDYFLIFQAVGFWGLVLIGRAIEEVCLELNVPQPPLLFFALFLPGLYFWTSAIGKDSPLFFASALAMWSTLRIQRRYLWFGIAISVMFPFRPHISLIALVALVAAIALDRRTRVSVRILLGAAVAVGFVIVAATLQQAMDVDVSNVGSVKTFIDNQNQVNSADVTSMANYPFVYKLFSLLFRPFFVDAGGLFGLVASFENLFVFAMFYKLAREWHLVIDLARRIAFFRYSLIFTMLLTVLLSVLFYNVGLGLRQKAMMMPTLLIMYAVIVLVSAIKRQQSQTQALVPSATSVRRSAAPPALRS